MKSSCRQPVAVATTLIVGIGSPAGDDRFGWQVVDRLREILETNGWHAQSAAMGVESNTPRPIQGVPHLRKVAVPGDLLAWLDGVAHLVICDACRGLDAPGQIARWEWPAAEVERLPASGSHDLGLAAVLELAAALGRLPPRVTVWACEAETVGPAVVAGGNVSAAVNAAANRVASEIAKELRLA